MSEQETFDRLLWHCIVDEDGNTRWLDHDDHLHRDGGPAFIEPDRRELWFQHGYLHREDGPASVYKDGDFKWARYGVTHREDGPAIKSGNSYMWFIDGRRLTEEEFKLWQLTNKIKPL